MVTDLNLNTGRDIYLDESNDLALVSGEDQLQQSVAIDVSDVLQDFIGATIEGGNVGLLEERVRQSLVSDEQVQNVQTVNLVKYNKATNTATLKVILVDDEDFTIEV